MSGNSNYKDAELAALIRQGDKQAFEELANRYHRQIYFFALKYLHSKEYAEDAVQDVFLKLWEKRETIDHSKSIRNFLFTSMRNHVLNMIRDQKKNPVTQYDPAWYEYPAQNVTSDEVDYVELQELLGNGMKGLTERRREIFELKAIQGFNNEEVAYRLSISVNTVKLHYNHTLKTMKAYLQRHSDLLN